MVRVVNHSRQWIPKYSSSLVEADFVSSEIRRRLSGIPLESHLWIIAELMFRAQRKGSHRVGGGVTSAVLPHHRTYGSVYGGSRSPLKPEPLIAPWQKSTTIKEGF